MGINIHFSAKADCGHILSYSLGESASFISLVLYARSCAAEAVQTSTGDRLIGGVRRDGRPGEMGPMIHSFSLIR